MIASDLPPSMVKLCREGVESCCSDDSTSTAVRIGTTWMMGCFLVMRCCTLCLAPRSDTNTCKGDVPGCVPENCCGDGRCGVVAALPWWPVISSLSNFLYDVFSLVFGWSSPRCCLSRLRLSGCVPWDVLWAHLLVWYLLFLTSTMLNDWPAGIGASSVVLQVDLKTLMDWSDW